MLVLRGFVKSDKEVIAEALGGSEKAYATLTSLYRQRIYRFIRRRVLNDAEAEELTQDVFLYAYKELAAFKGDCALYTWLCTIAHRKALRHPFNDSQSTIDIVDVVTPESLLTIKQSVEQVTSICDTLPSKQRRALLLKEYDGLPYIEIAAILGCSPLYAKKLVWKAKKTIRREMNDK